MWHLYSVLEVFFYLRHFKLDFFTLHYKQSKNTNNASELFLWDISGNFYLIYRCLYLFLGWLSIGFTPAFPPLQSAPAFSTPAFFIPWNRRIALVTVKEQRSDGRGEMEEREWPGEVRDAESSLKNSQTPTLTPWAPAGMGKRGHLPLWKCCEVFLLISSYSKTLSGWTNYLCIIFTTCRRLLGAPTPDPHLGFIPWPRWRTFVPRPLIFPPLEKILRAPMSDSDSELQWRSDGWWHCCKRTL